jgi:hypothetical protein
VTVRLEQGIPPVTFKVMPRGAVVPLVITAMVVPPSATVTAPVSALFTQIPIRRQGWFLLIVVVAAVVICTAEPVGNAAIIFIS